MIPTAKLRWVDRLGGDGVKPVNKDDMYVRVLQQWWSAQSLDLGFGTIEIGKGEWRDVPLEEET
jgi:hypothetical protein